MVCPTARLSINPGGSTRGNFQIDMGGECIPEETKRVVNDKKDQEKLQDFTWTLVVRET